MPLPEAVNLQPFELLQFTAIAATLSQQCYSRTQLLGLNNFKIVALNDDEQDPQRYCHYIIALNEGVVYVAFKGSDALSNWVANVFIDQQNDEHGRVHSGFWQSFQSAKDRLSRDLQPYFGHPVVFCGHSKGGALANLAAAYFAHEFQQKKWILTFGAPKVGDKRFATYLNSQMCLHLRLENQTDPVPFLPPLSKYAHAGNPVDLGTFCDRLRTMSTVGMVGTFCWRAFQAADAATHKATMLKKVGQVLADGAGRLCGFEAIARMTRDYGFNDGGVLEAHTLDKYHLAIARAQERAQEIIESQLAQQERGITASLGVALKSGIKSLLRDCKALYRLIRDPNAGVSKAQALLASAALVYVVSPWDVIPDSIPFVGYSDDVFVVRTALDTLNAQVNRYRRDDE
ncbi:uncharacterized protein MONBRDRAFT_36670 [Monosiga brevicollis MX1]|uniref:DUF1232 domain-containing protein n=1 Tax=Monosiga brevicollis TaxID=81824 RepID=A9UWR5_MONBE|nr:uncharacterized protein MONBRDRAFT_36670 [Monosiga brevicollis MX1]EDQ90260.1 predicted protein [Monosiga brevicollis MX1]|eukprot:XP_001745027.1 hypothetical protein [Monosiga brevicollis MX1]